MFGVLGVGEELGQPEGCVCGAQVDHAEMDEEGRDDVVGEDGEVVRARGRGSRGSLGEASAGAAGLRGVWTVIDMEILAWHS